jgi:hypothetical protein
MPASSLIRGALFGLLLAMVLVGCDEATGLTDPTPPASTNTAVDDSLWILRFAQDAPPLADTVVSFWAVKGDNREVEIRYLPTESYRGGTCLYFKVPGDALLRSPDGRLYQRGDSVRITIRVVRTTQYNFEFAPAGLQFSADKPAELRVYYDWMNRDINGDGRVDDEDERLFERLGFWRQERPGERWSTVQTEREPSFKRARAEIRGFTRYAMATN